MYALITQDFANTLQVISFKNEFTSCTDEVREKVPSLNITTFLRYKLFHRDVIIFQFCLLEDVTDYRDAI